MGLFAQGISLLQETIHQPKLVIVQNAAPTQVSGGQTAVAPVAPWISIAVFAWNEERVIGGTLSALFGQSVFSELSKLGRQCEVICVVNGCSDGTPDVADRVLKEQARMHPYAHTFTARVANLQQRGKVNAWNQLVHALSAKEAELLVMMDADIGLYQPQTIWNMVQTLETDPEANVAVDRPRKDIQLKERKSVRDRISLGMSRLTGSAEAQLCGQLYAIRAGVARNIFLPKDLLVEDGFIKALVCTDFLAHGVVSKRIRLAPEAEHIFEAYTNPVVILRNQKRQVIAQTIVHILIDQHLPSLVAAEKSRLGATLWEKEMTEPAWIKQLIAAHLSRTRFFWRLYPGLLTQRFKYLNRLSPMRRLACLPAALASFCVMCVASFLAWKALRRGATDYWPKAERAASPMNSMTPQLRPALK
jgi:Glycosyl transferase family 2